MLIWVGASLGLQPCIPANAHGDPLSPALGGSGVVILIVGEVGIMDLAIWGDGPGQMQESQITSEKRWAS